jgi:hypothetical protein
MDILSIQPAATCLNNIDARVLSSSANARIADQNLQPVGRGRKCRQNINGFPRPAGIPPIARGVMD